MKSNKKGPFLPGPLIQCFFLLNNIPASIVKKNGSKKNTRMQQYASLLIFDCKFLTK